MATRFTLTNAAVSSVYDLKKVPLNALGNSLVFNVASTSNFDGAILKVKLYDDADNTSYLNNFSTQLSVAGIAQPQGVAITQAVGGVRLEVSQQGFIEFYIDTPTANTSIDIWVDNLNIDAVVS